MQSFVCFVRAHAGKIQCCATKGSKEEDYELTNKAVNNGSVNAFRKTAYRYCMWKEMHLTNLLDLKDRPCILVSQPGCN